MRVEAKKIEKYCRDYLKASDFQDYCYNGLQVEGVEKVSKIITGVSLSQKLIEAAINKNARMIIVHHGIFKKAVGNVPRIKGALGKRLKLLLENNINLLGFHLPLDAHPVIGNNISICRLLGIQKTKPFSIGFIGELKESLKFNDFVDLVNKKLSANSYVIAAGSKRVKRIGVISGGASPEFQAAAELGADTYICGDIRESVVREVEEMKMNFINAGHYNTEVLGVKNLGNLIAEKFNINVEFIDIPCDV